MPKVTFMQNQAKREADILNECKRKLKIEFRGAIGKIRGSLDLADCEIARMAGFPQSTFSVRTRKPETFSIEDMFKLIIKFPEIRESFIDSIPKV